MLALSKFNFILLSAGRSERMGFDKATLDFHGQPWIQAQLQEIAKSESIAQILVVANPLNKSQIQKIVAELGELKPIHVLENGLPGADTFSSLLIALRAMRSGMVSPMETPQNCAVMVSPVDTPQSCAVIDALGAEIIADIEALLPECQGKKGHPVGLGAALIDDLINGKATRLDFYLKSLPTGQVKTVQVEDPRISLNLNTREAWSEFLANGNF